MYFIPSIKKRSAEKDAEVDKFFELLHTPIAEEDKPKISPDYIRTLVWLFAFSFVTAGLLFVVMSIPTIKTDGGLYSCLAGIVCLVGALVLVVAYRRKKK